MMEDALHWMLCDARIGKVSGKRGGTLYCSIVVVILTIKCCFQIVVAQQHPPCTLYYEKIHWTMNMTRDVLRVSENANGEESSAVYESGSAIDVPNYYY